MDHISSPTGTRGQCSQERLPVWRLIMSDFIIIAVVAIVGFYLTAAFIVAKTGSTEGLADLGKAAAAILRVLFSKPGGDQ
ncbi:hypothetical protein MycrhDRAFT_5723 [Mycolicibacterium rhodesiae JS60]|nr:hypothetical protein MycrhDRAFT_5723 [Mycolicibacterium rhodesiae JS60]